MRRGGCLPAMLEVLVLSEVLGGEKVYRIVVCCTAWKDLKVVQRALGLNPRQNAK